MALKDLLDREYGVKTDTVVNPVTASVATTVTQILKNNPNRLAWSLCNLGGNPVYLAFSQDPSSTKGIYIARNGGTIILLWNEDFELVTFPVWGIADTAAADVYLTEVFSV